MLTEKKQQLIDQIQAEVYNSVSSEIYLLNSGSLTSVSHTIQRAIEKGIMSAVTRILENVYTDEEMERDLKLSQ